MELTPHLVRVLIRSNLFDGSEDGITTIKVKTLLEEIEEILNNYLGIYKGENNARSTNE